MPDNYNQEPNDIWAFQESIIIACPYCTKQFYGQHELSEHYHDVHREDDEGVSKDKRELYLK